MPRRRDESPRAVARQAIERHVARHHYSPATQLPDFARDLIVAERRRVVRKVRKFFGGDSPNGLAAIILARPQPARRGR